MTTYVERRDAVIRAHVKVMLGEMSATYDFSDPAHPTKTVG
ncbi:MAG TPA: hypothetical protein VLE97_08030 [Gaiellaceae bacterium]|nr:hypothetical protein [Gaiellaceae bacterium]